MFALFINHAKKRHKHTTINFTTVSKLTLLQQS